MRSYLKFAAIGLLCMACSATATSLLDYTPPANEDTPLLAHSPGVPASYSSSFAVGSQDVVVTSIFFRLDGQSTHSYDFTAWMFTDSEAGPGATLASSHRFFPQGDFNLQGLAWYEFPLTSALTLSANTTYWAGIGTSSAGNPPYIAYSPDLSRFTGFGVTPHMTHATSSSYPGTSWSVNSPTIRLVYELEGAVVPEPSAAVLWPLAACVICLRVLRRGQNTSRLLHPARPWKPLRP